jgi:hypothetical protein
MRCAIASKRSVITMSQREAVAVKKVAVIGGGYAGGRVAALHEPWKLLSRQCLSLHCDWRNIRSILLNSDHWNLSVAKQPLLLQPMLLLLPSLVLLLLLLGYDCPPTDNFLRSSLQPHAAVHIHCLHGSTTSSVCCRHCSSAHTYSAGPRCSGC